MVRLVEPGAVGLRDAREHRFVHVGTRAGAAAASHCLCASITCATTRSAGDSGMSGSSDGSDSSSSRSKSGCAIEQNAPEQPRQLADRVDHAVHALVLGRRAGSAPACA